jgi:hypothetical protein
MFVNCYTRAITSANNYIDLLQVYAYPNSKLTEVAQKCGLNAQRFSQEDGDPSTHAGQVELLTQIVLFRPRHVWLSPECGPWSSWNRIIAHRSVHSWQKIKGQQQASRIHLRLCHLIAKIQISEGRHVHFENPCSAITWTQPEKAEFLKMTLPARLDHCMFGLQHPETDDAMQKKTRVQTSSREMCSALGQRVCEYQHKDTPIAGSCKIQNHRMQVSQCAGFYPRTFACDCKGYSQNQTWSLEAPAYHVDEHVEL